MVVRYFCDIQPAYGSILKSISVDPFKDTFKPDFHQKIYFVKSTSKKRKLFMNFLLPSIEKNYKNKSLDYLAYLINYEGRYSLNSYLRKKSLALNVVAKIGARNFEGNSLFTFFTIEAGLTRDGYENISSVLDAIFSYLLIIKMTPMEIHRETFEQFREVKEILFKYRKEKQQLENVQELALNMMHCKDEDIVVGKEIFNDFDEGSLRKFIELINDRRFNLLILSDQYQKYDKLEPWFGTQYAVEGKIIISSKHLFLNF
jgi:nardilysin